MIISFSKINSYKFLCLLFCFFIPIDMLNGELIRQGLISVSAIFKFLVLMLSVVVLLKNKKIRVVFFFLFSLILYLFFHFIILGDPVEVLQGLSMLLRFLAIYIFYHFFCLVIKKGYSELIYKIAFISFFFILLNIFLGGMGFGYAMYGAAAHSIGTRGFIYAGNEIGVALVASASIVMMVNVDLGKYRNFFILGSLALFASILMSLKVAMLGSIFLMLSLPLTQVFKSSGAFSINKRSFFYSQVFILITPLFGFLGGYYSFFHLNLIDRISFFYGNLDFLTFIFSGRNIWFLEAYDAFIKKYTALEVLFGRGNSWWEYISNRKSVEIDLADFAMSYGFLGLFLTYGWILIVLFRNIMNHHYYKLHIFLISSFLLMVSLTAGHVFNSGTAGFLIAIILAIGTTDKPLKLAYS